MKYLIIFLTLINFAYGQESALFDRSFHYRTDDLQSENKREYSINDSLIEINDFNQNGIFRQGKFYGFTDLKNLDEFIWYNTNKQYDKNPELKIANRKGIVKYLNAKGEVTSEQLFIEGNTKFIQLWKEGKPCLTNGTGKYEFHSYKRNEKMVRIFKDSVETEGFIVRELKKDTIYNKTDTNAYPKTELKSFYNDLASNINYPRLARILGVNKKIMIEFIVDEMGNLIDFEPLNDKSWNFEKKVIRKLEKMPRWTPATVDGKNVKTRFIIPLTFKH